LLQYAEGFVGQKRPDHPALISPDFGDVLRPLKLTDARLQTLSTQMQLTSTWLEPPESRVPAAEKHSVTIRGWIAGVIR
jgi:hypothetical protein